MWCVFIILGIVAEVLKANAILVIPTIVEYILFGIGGLLLVLKFIVYTQIYLIFFTFPCTICLALEKRVLIKTTF